MSTAAHRAPARWTIAGWNRRTAHRLWDARLGPSAAEALADVRLPAYRALGALLLLVGMAGASLVVLPARWPAVPIAAVLLAVAVVAAGVRPLRRAGAAVSDAVGAAGSPADRPAPLNDGSRFDAWVRRNDLAGPVLAVDLAAVLRAIR